TPTTAGAIALTATQADRSDTADIAASDPIAVSIATPTPATQDEGSTVEFPVSFTGASAGSAAAIQVPYTVAWEDTTFTDGMFTDLSGGTLSFAPGQTSRDIRVRIQHSIPLDSNSDDEVLRVTLGTITASGAGMVTSSGMADVTVNWVNAAHTIAIDDTTTPLTFTEGGAAQITVTRTASIDLLQPVDIMWAVSRTTGAGAAGTADFAGNALPDGTVRFSDSQTSATIDLPIFDDNLAEMEETFTLALSEALSDSVQTANGVVSADDSAIVVTITDNDAITISIAAPANISEDDTFRIPVRLSATPTAALSVMWTVAGATGAGISTSCGASGRETVAAVAGDFAAAAGTALRDFTSLTSQPLNFAIGDTEEIITLHTSGGAQSTAPSGAAMNTEMTGYDRSCNRRFTITLATSGNGGGSEPAMTPTTPATVTIREAAHIVTVAAPDPATVAEGGAAMFTVTRTGPTLSTPILITWTVRDAASGGDVVAADFGGSFPTGNVTFANDETVKTFTVSPDDDNLAEMSESFEVALSATSAVLASNDQVALGDPVTVAIADNDDIVVRLSGPSTAREGDTLTYTVTLSAEPTQPLMAMWEVTGAGLRNPAAQAGDFMGSMFPTGSLTFAVDAPRSQSITFTTSAGVAVDGSTDNTPDRDFTLSLSAPTGGGGTNSPMLSGSPLPVTLREAARVLAVTGPSSIAEGDSDVPGDYRIALIGDPFTRGTTVTWTVNHRTTDDDDFAAVTGTVNFDAGDRDRTFPIAVRGDSRSETEESFTVCVAVVVTDPNDDDGGTAYRNQDDCGIADRAFATAATVITDDDIIAARLRGPPGPPVVDEGTTTTYVVALSETPTAQLTAMWAVAAGTRVGGVIAARAGDFTGGNFPSGSLIFDIGVTERALSFTTSAGVAVDGSTDNTPDRVFTLSVTGISGGGGAAPDTRALPSLTVTIREDDPDARTVRIEQATAALNRAAV
ncbi:MAG: hypothetical protein OXU22_06290, partial [Gammaproteobacteria bacterium]|nr:hypothetical protein [Gammaproteobacteria bacterium]